MATKDGYMTQELLDVNRQLAEGGVGVILTSFMSIEKQDAPAPNMRGIYEDAFLPLFEVYYCFTGK